MTIFFYAIIELVTFSLFVIAHKQNKTKKSLVFLVWMILFAIVALRDISVGSDYETYYYAMRRVAEGKMLSYDYTWLSGGFRFLIKLVALTGISSVFVPIVISALLAGLTLFFFIKAFDELSIDPVLSLFVFFCFCYFFQMMNQFRQMFAIAVVLYSYKYINKSFVKYVLFIILAGLFHSSALIMIPMYFISKLKISRKVLLAYLAIGISVVFLYTNLRELLIYTPYAYYLGWESYDIGATESSVLNLIVRIVMLVFCLYFRKDVVAMDHKNKVLYHMVIICTILQVLAVYVQLFARITTYFYVFYILLFPYVVVAFKKKFTKNSRKYLQIMIYGMFILYQIVYFRSQGQESGYTVYSLLPFM